MVSMFVQNNMKKQEHKTRSESRDIDENKIVQWLCETFGIICRLATEWRQIPFNDVGGNMAGSNKRWRRRGFEPSQEKGVLKMKNGSVSLELILMIRECVQCCKFYPNCVSLLVLCLQKAQER